MSYAERTKSSALLYCSQNEVRIAKKIWWLLFHLIHVIESTAFWLLEFEFQKLCLNVCTGESVRRKKHVRITVQNWMKRFISHHLMEHQMSQCFEYLCNCVRCTLCNNAPKIELVTWKCFVHKAFELRRICVCKEWDCVGENHSNHFYNYKHITNKMRYRTMVL